MKITQILSKIVLLSFLLALQIFAQEEPAYNLGQEHQYIETMTDENYTDIINEYDPIIIKFYSPLCGISKAMALDYATLGETFSNEKKDLIFFQVDATIEKKTAEFFGIAKSPEVVLIVEKQKIFFPYQYTKNIMLDWINLKLYNPTQEINEISDFKEALANNEVVVAYFGEKNDNYKTYLQLARINEKFKFIHSYSESIAKHFEIEKTPSLIIFKQFDKERLQYKEEDFELGKLIYFLKENAFATIQEVDQETFQKIMVNEKPSLFLFLDRKKHSKEQSELESISEELKKDTLIFTSELKNKYEDEFAQFFGIKQKNLPIICMLEMPYLKKYQMNEEITSENIANFITLWKLGKLNFYLKSEEIPEDDEDEPVKKIVGKNFNQIVMDDKMDVIVNFCSKKEKLCRTLDPIYERVAEKYQNYKTLLFGSYDVNENQNEGVIIRKTPKIIYYPKNKKDNPIIYDNTERTEATIQAFIETNLQEKKEEL